MLSPRRRKYVREYMREWRKKNADQVRDRKHTWRMANPLGVPLSVSEGRGGSDNSPSLDRLIPELGYVRGNVWVISNRANTIKNNATPDELELVAKKVRERLQACSI